MDNLTHSLLGAVVGETLARFVPTAKALLPEPTRRSLYVSLMVIGGNLPDLDSLYARITGGKLGYLLHHRGHTHTVVGAIVIALLMYGVCLLWLRWRSIASSRGDRWWLAAIALLAPLLHIAMDATNEYGVHPFWPFDNHWMYGDAIFIVEPLFWAAAAPLVFLLQHRVARGAVSVIVLAGIALSFGTGLVPAAMAVGLTLLTVGLLLIAWRASARVAAASALVASFGVIATFLFAGNIARQQVDTFAAAQYPNAVLLDSVLAPMPVNPLCWEVILMQLEDDDYTLRQALMSLAPGWMPAAACPAMSVRPTVGLAQVTALDTDTLQWLDEVTMSRRDAQLLLAENCEALAFAGFARALWFTENAEGWLVGDLRYDREPELGFAEMQLAAEPEQCPRFVPPWIPPRADLLDTAL
jgi:inner membrane protein